MRGLDPRNLLRWLPWLLGGALLLVHGVEVVEWSHRNGIPDGHQNEFLHIGNALDLWGAFVDRDGWHLRYYLTTNYWPPGFYLAPWPLFAVMGPRHIAMVLTNLGHLAVLLAATYLLGVELRGRWTGLAAMGLLTLYPSIYGNLVRFEPNVAVCAWVTLGAVFLVRSRGFSDRRAALMFGIAVALGLLMDRLSLGVFLALPAGVVWVSSIARGDARKKLVGGLACLVVVALIAGWWHVEFFTHNLDELLSQGGIGEVDSTGTWTEQRDAWAVESFLFYPASLLDSQAGVVLGVLGLGGIAAALAKPRGPRLVPLLIVLSAVGLFTLVQKKQAFYTIPMLGCVAVLSAELLVRLGRPGVLVGAVMLFCGLHGHSRMMWDRGLALPAVFENDALPERYVAPRFPQALAPRGLRLPLESLSGAIPGGEVVVFSEDVAWFEGYVVLQLRERLPGQKVRGLISDPRGVYEWFDTAQGFVHVSTSRRGGAWPRESRMSEALEAHHYDLSDLPPVLSTITAAEQDFEQVASWPLEHGGRVVLFRRTTGR